LLEPFVKITVLKGWKGEGEEEARGSSGDATPLAVAIIVSDL
jgi:hypothetical protein